MTKEYVIHLTREELLVEGTKNQQAEGQGNGQNQE